MKVNAAEPELQGGQRGSHPQCLPCSSTGSRWHKDISHPSLSLPCCQRSRAGAVCCVQESWQGRTALLPSQLLTAPALAPCPGHIPRHWMLSWQKVLLLPTEAPGHASFCLRNSSRETATPSGHGLLLLPRVLDSSDKGTDWKERAAPEPCALCLPVASEKQPQHPAQNAQDQPTPSPQPNPHHPQG